MQAIHHRPLLDVDVIIAHYSEKDGVPVSYVCTSAPNEYADYAVDVFYRETPHPVYGNRYFGLYRTNAQVYITNLDNIEGLYFNCIEVEGQWHYSQHRHDCHFVGDVAIDGGRSYNRYVGNMDHPKKCFVIKDGVFIEKENE